MPSMMYALVDCNNFFVSCERVFDPTLRGKPVIVLSSNDGCAVSRSNEAKELGIEMGIPAFTIRELLRKHKVVQLSSNFALYGDLSARVMSIICSEMQNVEVYSIDEAFIDLSDIPRQNLQIVCVKLAEKIEQCTGIPVSIGIGQTRTLAKIANHIVKNNAKKGSKDKVYCIDSAVQALNIFQSLDVGEVWSIGRKLRQRLGLIGINTVAQLINMPDDVVKRLFNVVMLRTIRELRGIDCVTLPDIARQRQQVMVSRSFGRKVTDLCDIQEALALHVSSAASKLRKHKLITRGIYVFLHTSMHSKIDKFYKNAMYIPLPAACNDTLEILRFAKQGLQQIFISGYFYQKVGVMMCDLLPESNAQVDMFAHSKIERDGKIMRIMDEINARHGRHTLQIAAVGLEQDWRVKADKLSSSYVSDWNQLPVVSLD